MEEKVKDTNYIKKMSSKTFCERKKETNLIIIPTGAFEVYGPHLPLGSDTLVAVKMAELIANKVNGLIGPTIEAGDSSMLNEFPGTITIKPESFKNYLMDIVNSMKEWGFRDFLFINSHAGNVPMINQICYEIRNAEGIRCAQIDFWRFIKSQDKGIFETGDAAHSHASEAGTSVILYMYPELVDIEEIIDEPRIDKDEFPEILKYTKLSSYTKSGTVGFATKGTREKGETIVNKSVERIVEFLNKTWKIQKLE